MKYFNHISSLSDLKDQFRTLVLANHPDKGGNTETMQNINAEFDGLYSFWQYRTEDKEDRNSEKKETGKEYRRNFYTENGWEGHLYDSKLSTKDIAARVRIYAKERWTQYKFSVRTEYYSGGSSIHLTLVSGPEVAFIAGTKEEERGYVSTCRNVRGYPGITEIVSFVVNDVCDYMGSYNYDDSDGMIDYFDVNFYTNITIGSWEKLYEVKAGKSARIKEDEKQNDSARIEPEQTVSITVNSLSIEIIEYSEKSIAVFGETKQIKDRLKELGGRFNKFLNYGDGKRAGWIFPKTKRAALNLLFRPDEKEPEVPELSAKEPAPERKPMNDGAYMSFASCVQKRLLSAGYEAGRKYAKEMVQRYTMRIDQVRYIAFILSDFGQRYGTITKTGAA